MPGNEGDSFDVHPARCVDVRSGCDLSLEGMDSIGCEISVGGDCSTA